MSVEALGGGASVGTSDRSGGNNVGDECRIGIDQNEESSDQRFVEASGGGASVGTSDRSGGNNVGDECRIGIDQNEESSDQRFVEASGGGASVGTSDRSGGNNVGNQIEESSDQRFSRQEKALFVSFEKDSEVVNKTSPPDDAKPNIRRRSVPYMALRNKKLNNYFQHKKLSFGTKYYLPFGKVMGNRIKINLAAEFLQHNGVKKEDLYEDIQKQIKELWKCYDEYGFNHLGFDQFLEDTSTLEDTGIALKDIAWMLLVDGCAILQFMYISVGFWEIRDTQFRKFGIKTDDEVFIAHDLFLLQNQLPYQLLQLIIRHTSKQDELLKSIYKFIFYYFRTPEEWNKNKGEILKDLKHDHVHLLDLLHKKFIQPLHQIDEKRDLIEIIIGWTVVLFDKLKCNRNEFDRDRFPVPFRNIEKLREAGINLKRNKTSYVGDISFSGGTLKLPRIILDESTATMFLNMLAYEMSVDFQNKSEVSSYMYLLHKLIDKTQDVEELREKNILLNELGSDEEMVELFNEIGKCLSPNLERYDEVKRNIDNYFDNKGLIWMHKISHDIHQYFKRRWSLLAFIGAFLAVASSIIQTVITVLAYQADSKKGN